MNSDTLKKSAAVFLLSSIILTSPFATAKNPAKLLGPADIAKELTKDWNDSSARGCDPSDKTKVAKVDVITSGDYKKWIKRVNAGKELLDKVVADAGYIRVTFPSRKSVTGSWTYGR